jgi:hypothetical protein
MVILRRNEGEFVRDGGVQLERVAGQVNRSKTFWTKKRSRRVVKKMRRAENKAKKTE